jgi:hypothetical protein
VAILAVAATVVLVYWLILRKESLPRPDAVAPPPPRTGTLSVSSQPPGASIHLEGKPTGLTTPSVIRDLARKHPYRLKLTLKGFKPWTKKVHFGDMEMVALDAQLTRLPRKPPPKPRPKPRYGILNINAVPVWAYVYIDGKKQPRPTPLYNLKLKPGSHEIRLENPKLKITKSHRITIKAGKSKDLVVRMK